MLNFFSCVTWELDGDNNLLEFFGRVDPADKLDEGNLGLEALSSAKDGPPTDALTFGSARDEVLLLLWLIFVLPLPRGLVERGLVFRGLVGLRTVELLYATTPSGVFMAAAERGDRSTWRSFDCITNE
jgi:hypothetical protein